jgi:hypothetical protein
MKGIVECSNGEEVYRYNYRKGSALDDVHCSQKDAEKGLCLAKCLGGSDETTYSGKNGNQGAFSLSNFGIQTRGESQSTIYE